MVTTDTGTTVKNNLAALKKAVGAVTKANKSWLLALETFLESIDPNSTDPAQSAINLKIAAVVSAALPGIPNVNPQGSGQNFPPAQTWRLALDELSLQQLLDRKLEGKFSQLDATTEGLGKAVMEAEAYLVMTDEAFTFLKGICQGTKDKSGNLVNGIETITGIDSAFQTSLAKLRAAADDARNKNLTGLAPLVATILSSSGQAGGIVLPSREPEGTDLLLGRSFGQCADNFLALMPVGSAELAQTVTLLSGGSLTLSDKQLVALTNSWGKVIKQVTDGLATATPTFTIADLFCIHTTVDTLYDRVETNVTRDIDIVSTEF